MGQRTQLVLKITDRYGKTVNKVYHEQWGFGKTMPLIILEFLISMNYGNQRKYTETFHKPSVDAYQNALKSGNKTQLKNMLELAEKTSTTNLELPSWDVTEEYENNYIYERTSADGKPYYEVLNSAEVDGVKGIEQTTWDFPDDVNAVRTFTGDNNDGLAYISVKETDNGHYDGNIEIKVGFLVNNCTTTRNNTSNTLDEVAINRFHNIHSYTKYYKNYCPRKVMSAIENLYELFEVEQLGKDYGKQKAAN